MEVSLLDVNAQNQPLRKELIDAFVSVLDSGSYILGDKVEEFEKTIANYLGVEFAIGVSSGTDAILMALMMLEISQGDEVLCPAFTFFSTASCVARVDAEPVWVDACASDFNINIKDAEKKISKKTKAIIVAHLFGQACNLDELLAFCEKHNLLLIEDCAQSLGAKYKGQCVGSFGDVGTYSFYPTKNLGGFGDSGLLVVKDERLLAKAKMLRNHGSLKKYFHKWIGGNFRIDAIQAALLLAKFRHYVGYLKKRRINANLYDSILSSLHGKGLFLPKEQSDCEHTWTQYTIRVLNGKRNLLQKHLSNAKINTAIYYPVCLNHQECFVNSQKGCETINMAPVLSKEVLSLPIYPELRKEHLEYVAKTILSFFNNHG